MRFVVNEEPGRELIVEGAKVALNSMKCINSSCNF
jgi:hypothetical protein